MKNCLPRRLGINKYYLKFSSILNLIKKRFLWLELFEELGYNVLKLILVFTQKIKQKYKFKTKTSI